MLGLSVLTAGTLAAGATGTLAWFTTNKTATATYKNIVAASTTGNLKASIQGVTNKASKSDKTDYTVTAEQAGSKTSDVSSQDGINFAQPDWKNTASNVATTTINGVKSVTSKDGYFTQFYIDLTNANTPTGDESTDANVAAIKVSLTGVKISGDNALAGWTRMAIITSPEKDDVSNRITKGTSTLYQNSISSDDLKKYTPENPKATTMGDALKPVTNNIYAASETLAEGNGKLEISTSLAAGATISVGVAVWLEGTLESNQDSAKGQSVDVTLTFKGEEL